MISQPSNVGNAGSCHALTQVLLAPLSALTKDHASSVMDNEAPNSTSVKKPTLCQKTQNVALKIIALIGTIILLPLVITGLILQSYSSKRIEKARKAEEENAIKLREEREKTAAIGIYCFKQLQKSDIPDGLFRVSGSKARQTRCLQQMKDACIKESDLTLGYHLDSKPELIDSNLNKYDLSKLATLCLGDLSLIKQPDDQELIDLIISLPKANNKDENITPYLMDNSPLKIALQQWHARLLSYEKDLLKHALQTMAGTAAKNNEQNRLNLSGMAIILAPNLYPEATLTNIQSFISFSEILLEHYKTILPE
jgi:hypothetical protein